jgi:hypothetical protein
VAPFGVVYQTPFISIGGLTGADLSATILVLNGAKGGLMYTKYRNQKPMDRLDYAIIAFPWILLAILYLLGL